jgi:hypothetical protein
MAERRYKGAADKCEPGGFVKVSSPLLQSQDFANLTVFEKQAFFDLMAQYRGNNNGDLAMTWRYAIPRGWRSKSTLYKALDGLTEKGFIIKTKQGDRTHKPNLYALTCFIVDWCGGKLDIKAPADHRGKWRKHPTPMPSLKPTRYPKDPAVRELLRKSDPEGLKQLARNEYQIPPDWYASKGGRPPH